MKIAVWLIVGLGSLLSVYSRAEQLNAKYLQILHTNDLHSYWEHSSKKTLGGLARIKFLLDQMEKEGDKKGWTTIRIDAGDFSEGNINFHADNGDTSFRIMKAMKYDAIALGNHDYITGIADLRDRLKKSDQSIPVIAANFVVPADWSLPPGLVLNRGGMKIAIGAVTTDEPYFKWFAKPAIITSPVKALRKFIEVHKDADIRIALTHIGWERDYYLPESIPQLDVVVGGHTHTLLRKPLKVMGISGRKIPVFQTGAHGAHIGRALFQLTPGKPGSAKLIDYKMVEVPRSAPEDPVVRELINKGLVSLQNKFNHRLETVITHVARDYYTHKVKAPVVGNILADAMREAAGTQIAFDSGKLYADLLEKGYLTFHDVLDISPHLYSWSSPGWKVYRCEETGHQIRKMLIALGALSKSIFVSGMEFDLHLKVFVSNMKINGQPLDDNKIYSVAVSEGLLRGTDAFPRMKSVTCSRPIETQILMRDAIFRKLSNVSLIDNDILGPIRIHGPKNDLPKLNLIPDTSL